MDLILNITDSKTIKNNNQARANARKLHKGSEIDNIKVINTSKISISDNSVTNTKSDLSVTNTNSDTSVTNTNSDTSVTKKAFFVKKANVKIDPELKVDTYKTKDSLEKENKKIVKKASLVLDEDCHIKDMEALLSSSKGSKFEPVFSDKTFAKFSQLHPLLVKTLSDRMKITIATAIQNKAIPALLEGKDTLIKSSTGSGKTLSYAIPMVNALGAIEPPIHRGSGIQALIISPTRELAIQTHEVLTKLTNTFVRIQTGTLIGGVKWLVQKRALRKGLNILIVTPNRLLQHIGESSKLDLTQLKWLIIDEADRISELGFCENVKKIIDDIKKQKDINTVQTVLLSATLTQGVENLAGLALKNPVRAEVEFVNTTSDCEDKNEGALSNFLMPSGLQHYLLVCPTKLRMVALISFLLLKCKYGKHTGKVVVFMTTQDLVEFHFQLFSQFLKEKCLLEDLPNAEANKLSNHSDIEIYQLHGGMEHDKRQAVFKNFSACKNGFMLTTDVCARGLDMAGISWVVQYHPPGHPVDYIHRVGRTARAGNTGKALLFLQPAEINYVNHLQTVVGGLEIQRVAMRSVLQAALYHSGSIKQKRAPIHTVEESIFLTAKVLEQHVDHDPMLHNLGRAAFKSLVGSYATFSKEMREFFCYKDLHLGHVAKSMAMVETPKEISQRAERSDTSKLSIDKRKKIEAKSSKKRPSSESKKDRTSSKKPRLDQAHRNMMAEFGL